MRQYTHVWPHVEPFQSKQDDCEYWAYSTKLCASYNDVMIDELQLQLKY